MTAKRFEMGYDDGLLRFVKDNVTNTNLDIVDCWTVLNELNDENEHIKQNCKNYTWYKQYKQLLNENEQLKQELFETSKELLWATSDEVDRALHYEDEVEELRKEILLK